MIHDHATDGVEYSDDDSGDVEIYIILGWTPCIDAMNHTSQLYTTCPSSCQSRLPSNSPPPFLKMPANANMNFNASVAGGIGLGSSLFWGRPCFCFKMKVASSPVDPISDLSALTKAELGGHCSFFGLY